MKKKLLSLLIMSLMVLSLVACGSDEPKETEETTTEAATEATEAEETETEAEAGEPLNIAVIVKATSSDFWQYMLVGSDNYAHEFPDRVVTTNYGAPEEIDIEEQVAILEDVISTNPDAIVIAASNSDAPVNAIADAMSKGIPVITVDNRVTTDNYTSFIATDNLAAGAQAADFMLEQLKAVHGDDLSGKAIGVISALSGAQVITDRDQGFLDRMAEIAPELELLEKQVADNDMAKAMNIAENYISANPNLIGIFADNNATGSGLSRTISQLGVEDTIVGVAFDSDPEEINGLESGSLKGLILQDPFQMGYKGVDFAYTVATGGTVEKEFATPTTIVTKDNMNDDDIKGLLDPFTLKVK